MFRDVSECSGMFRHVPGCSMFLVLSTPAGNIISSRKNSRLTPYKGIRIPESGKFLFVEWGIREILLVESRIQNGLGERSSGMIRIKITRIMVDQMNRRPLSRVDSSVHLIYHGPSDLGSLILIRIIPKDRSLRFLSQSCILDFMPRIRNSRYWILDSLSVEWIPDSNH